MNSNSNKQKDILESVTEQIFTTLPSKKTQQTPNKQNQKNPNSPNQKPIMKTHMHK